METDSTKLRNAFGSFITGVTVVTTRVGDQKPVGFTANSFTSVSLQPPLLLVCPSKILSSYSTFERCEHFAVTVLAEDQRALANLFVSGSGDRFSGIEWQPDANGCPIFPGAAATFSMRVHERVDAGDHLILIGEVETYECSGKVGLGYSSEGYFSLGLERRAADVPRSSDVTAGAIVAFEDKVLLLRAGDQWYPPQIESTGRRGSLTAIRSYLAEAGIAANFGPVYTVFDNQSDGVVFTYYRASIDSPPSVEFGELVAVDDLASLNYRSEAIAAMMHRYAVEFRQGVFRLYVGDELQGVVQTTGEDTVV
jgi:flavin reductase (DIM6/NTAB) family NADH-FMN oxidoreductase RutF